MSFFGLPYHPESMERWAANTLRSFGIILTTIVVVCGCLLLFLESQCAAKGNFGHPDPNAAATYMFCAILLGLGGIALVAWLARGIVRSWQSSRLVSQTADAARVEDTGDGTPSAAAQSGVTTHLSPDAYRSVDGLFWCIAIELAVSALHLLYSIVRYQAMAQPFHSLIPAMVISSLLYAVPHAVLAYLVGYRFNRIVLAFAIGLPAATILHVFVSIIWITRFYHQPATTLLQLALPLLFNLVIIVFAYQVVQRTRLHPPVSSVLAAGILGSVYLSVLRSVTPILYRLWRG